MIIVCPIFCFLLKANHAEQEKYQADIEQQKCERIYLDVEELVGKLQKGLRRSINKSKYSKCNI